MSFKRNLLASFSSFRVDISLLLEGLFLRSPTQAVLFL